MLSRSGQGVAGGGAEAVFCYPARTCLEKQTFLVVWRAVPGVSERFLSGGGVTSERLL